MSRPRFCKCGCGRLTSGGFYISGHNFLVDNPQGNPERPPKEELYNRYILLEQSARDLASIYKVDQNTVWRWLVYYNIEVRSAAESHGTPLARWKNSNKVFDTPYRRALSRGNKRYWDNVPEENRGYHCEALSETMKQLWKDPTYRNRVVKAQAKGRNKGPSNLEVIMIGIVEAYGLPLKFNGNGEEDTVIKGYTPDFVATNGAKLVILVDGYPWHEDPIKEGKADRAYAESGYKTLHFTDEDLYCMEPDHIATMIKLESG